ncbi:HAMP domain-containing histidine kinase [Baekduia soli]|uniref:Sensor-like histidine kinase SenX3 n=1 Tax=Baekduia soli TaxID=496014 RepID=A0A5B8UA85_9ACTN|nr:HAMP domain-containing sensor histidine kinase [Baekduia soli]QEC50103.1 HAMP domain-containing histidine kinase [Baekduia soli]
MTSGDPARPPSQGELDAYAALAAHQLGEAVALVRGAASLLHGQRSRLGPGGEDALRALGAGTDRAQRFVDDLLDLVRASGEASEAPGAPLDAALDLAAADLDVAMRRAGLTLLREPLPASALGAGEAERLFGHLLRSALAGAARRIQITAETAGGVVALEVLDDGSPPRADTDPFAPFGRPRGRGPMLGAGVGMVVCRRLVERRGGTITITEGPDRVLVSIRVPAA